MAHKEMKAELTCPICMELFSQPRRLPCGHAYCHRCISTLLQVRSQEWASSRRLVCPECRDEMRVDYVLGIEALPLDFKLSRLVELMRSMETTSNSDGDESLSPDREFLESRPTAASPSALSSPSPSTPPPPIASEGFDFIMPNSSSPPPPYSGNELPFPEAGVENSTSDIMPFSEVENSTSLDTDDVPFPGLARTDYDDYLDTLTYPELWNEASLALNSLLESFQSGRDRLTHIHSSRHTADNQSISSLSSSSSSEMRTRRRQLSSSSSSLSDEDHPDQHWSIPSSSIADITPTSTTTIVAAADNDENGIVNGWENFASIQDERVDYPTQSNTVMNQASNPDAHTTTAAPSDFDTSTPQSNQIDNNDEDEMLSRLEAFDDDQLVNFFRNLHNYCDPEEYRILFQSGDSELQHESPESESLNVEARSMEKPEENNEGENKSNEVEVKDNEEENNKKGKDNFRIKYLKLKKKVVNIFKDTYSTTESSDEEIEQERERQRERERKKEEEVRAKEHLDINQKKYNFNKEKRKWRMTRHLMSLILSDYDSSSSESDSNLKRHRNGKKQKEAVDKSRDEMMEKDTVVNERRCRLGTDFDDNDRGCRNFSTFPYRSNRIKSAYHIDGNRRSEDDMNENGDDDDNDDKNFRRIMTVVNSTFNRGPHTTTRTQMPSPSHEVYPLPSIPPLLSAYDNIGNGTTDQSQASSLQNTNGNSEMPDRDVNVNDNNRGILTSRLSPLPSDQILNSLSSHSENQVGHLTSNMRKETQTAPSLTSECERSVQACNNRISRQRLVSENEDGGTFYDNIGEQEIAHAVQRSDPCDRFALGRFNHGDNHDPNNGLGLTTRPEIEDLKTASDDRGNDSAVLDCSQGLDHIDTSELYQDSTNGHFLEVNRMDTTKKGNNNNYCEIESLKDGTQTVSCLDQNTQKKEPDSDENGCCNRDVRSTTEVKQVSGAKHNPKGAKQKQKDVRRQHMGPNGTNFHPLSPSAVSLYDNLGDSRNSMQAFGRRRGEENTRFPYRHATRGEIERRKGGSGRHRGGERQSSVGNGRRDGNLGQDYENVVAGDEMRQKLPSSSVSGVACTSTSAAQASVAPQKLLLSPTTTTTTTAGHGMKQGFLTQNGLEGNVDNNISYDISDSGRDTLCMGGHNRGDSKDKADNNNGDDESDLEAAAPHSAMLKYSSGSGSSGKKAKSRFRKFISSLMRLSSSSSEDDADIEDCSDF